MNTLLFYAISLGSVNLPIDPPSSPYLNINIIEKIDEAQERLKDELVTASWCAKKTWGYKRVGKKRKRWTKIERYICEREQVAVVGNLETGELTTMRLGVMNQDEGQWLGDFYVVRVSENGVNSAYTVRYRAETDQFHWVVLALKCMVQDPYNDRKFEPAIYTPYTVELDMPVLRQRGADYLDDLINQATVELRQRYAFDAADARLSFLIEKQVSFSLDLIEHMDVDEFKAVGVGRMIAKVLTLLGANREKAFRYAVSRGAHARGLAQFIPNTYRDIRMQYAEARLHPDFIQGMNDHQNATMAQICLADRDLKIIGLHPDQLSNEDLGAFVAAAYNGGPHRAEHAIKRYGRRHWSDLGHGLAPQTVTYVREFRAVYHYLFGTIH